MTPRAALLLAASAGVALGLAGCAKEPHPPQTGGCYTVVFPKTKGGDYKFNLVKPSAPDLEHCAADLEVVRVEYLSNGGNRSDLWGVYQGHYIYINNAGLYSANSIDGMTYPLLVRTGDGRLARPGAVANPQ